MTAATLLQCGVQAGEWSGVAYGVAQHAAGECALSGRLHEEYRIGAGFFQHAELAPPERFTVDAQASFVAAHPGGFAAGEDCSGKVSLDGKL